MNPAVASLPVDPRLFAGFVSIMMVMAITPGPANIFAVATGVSKGRAAAMAGIVGMNVATLVWFGAAALGLGALVLAYPAAVQTIAIAGALYLAWLGIQSIRGSFSTAQDPDTTPVSTRRNALLDGFLVQIANPKAILFFTVVLPPFLDVNRPIVPQLMMFAAATIGMDMVSMTAYGLGGAALTRQMARPRFRRAFRIGVGLLLLTAALLIVMRL